MGGNVGEETAQTILSITSKAVLITAEVILTAIRALNNTLKTNNVTKNINKSSNEKSYNGKGQQSLKNLSKQNVALDNIPVSNIDIKNMKSLLKQYGVDFSVTKNRTTNDFSLFFKATDTAVISSALEQVVDKADNSQEEPKKPLKEQKEAAQEKADSQNKAKAEEKAKTQEQNKSRAGREQDR